MSFILDALRKSEHERQRQAGPALAEVAVAQPKPRTNVWATAAIVLLLVNLVAVGVLPPQPIAAGRPGAGPDGPTLVEGRNAAGRRRAGRGSSGVAGARRTAGTATDAAAAEPTVQRRGAAPAA